ncbi:MAG: glycosyltransferase family 1 protein [Bergeyella sp.]
MKKKILIDLERLRYPNSGIANVFRNLAKGLSETENASVDVSVFGPENEIKKDISTLKIINRKSFHKLFAPFLKGFDIVHVSHQLSSYFNADCKKTKKIVTLHDLNFLHENLSEKKRKKMLSVVNRNLRYADYIVCISEFVKQDFLKNRHLFSLKKLKEIEVIHNGIQLPESRIYDFGKYDFLKNKKYILNIGVLFDKKNQLPLVEMLPYISEDLVLIASDEKERYAALVKEKIQELNLQNRIHFLKNLSEEEKYAVIQNCEAMLHPSVAEGFGIPPIEAMAFGKPVFLSTFTSLPEIGGDCAFYFENFDGKKMAEFYLEKMKFFNENKEELELRIKNRTAQFDYKVMSKNYLDFYKRILK